MEILHTIAQHSKRTVLIVTHDTRIFHFANRILEMEDGHLVGDFTYDQFKGQHP
jgi:putative ABC transport system ATP-binding protein